MADIRAARTGEKVGHSGRDDSGDEERTHPFSEERVGHPGGRGGCSHMGLNRGLDIAAVPRLRSPTRQTAARKRKSATPVPSASLRAGGMTMGGAEMSELKLRPPKEKREERSYPLKVSSQ
jgi:hypothetical protein